MLITRLNDIIKTVVFLPLFQKQNLRVPIQSLAWKSKFFNTLPSWSKSHGPVICSLCVWVACDSAEYRRVPDQVLNVRIYFTFTPVSSVFMPGQTGTQVFHVRLIATPFCQVLHACTCVHFGWGQICKGVGASFSPFCLLMQVNASWSHVIHLHFGYILDGLKMAFFHLVSKFISRLLAPPFDQAVTFILFAW